MLLNVPVVTILYPAAKKTSYDEIEEMLNQQVQVALCVQRKWRLPEQNSCFCGSFDGKEA